MKNEIDEIAIAIANELKNVTVADILVNGAVQPAYEEGSETQTKYGVVNNATIAAKHGIFTMLLSGLVPTFNGKEGELRFAHSHLFDGITPRLLELLSNPLVAKQYPFLAAKIAKIFDKVENVQTPREVKTAEPQTGDDKTAGKDKDKDKDKK